MTIKIKIYEFDNVEELKNYEQQQEKEIPKKDFVSEKKQEISKIKEIESIMVEKPIKQNKQIKIPLINSMKRWTKEENKLFAEELIKCNLKGLSLNEAFKVCSEKLGRSIQTLYWKKSIMGIMYSNNKNLKSNKTIFIPRGNNQIYSKEEDDYLVEFVNKKYALGKQLGKKDFVKLCSKLKRTKPALKNRLVVLKQIGKINYFIKKIKKQEENFIKKEDNKIEEKSVEIKSEHKPYMLSSKANIPTKKNILNNIPSREYLFSKELPKSSEDLLKALINNDLKQRGICKLSMEKMNLIMDINKTSFENFTIDVLRFSNRIKNLLGISIVDFRKDMGGDYLIFS